MRIGYGCAGIGCGMLADRANGHDPAFAVEIDPFCCAVLRERADEGWFPGLEVHEADIKKWDPSPYAGTVDCFSFGFPCQDLSRIGSGAGLDGERSGLVWDLLRILGVLRCEYAFIENVPGLLSKGLDRLLCELARMGYDARWCDLSAAATAASHGRSRLWILAHAVRFRHEGIRGGGGQRRGQLSEAVAMAYADETGFQRKPSPRIRGRSDDYWHDAHGCLRDPPGREDRQGWEEAARHGAPEPGVRRLVDKAAWRMVKDQIAAVGNGQDTLAAACAWAILGGPVLT